MAKFPLSLFFILTALSSADSYHSPPFMGFTSTTSPNGPGPNFQAILGPSSDPTPPPPPTLSFFMHDILGGSHPTARTVTGTTPKPEPAAAALPFSKPNKSIFPLPGGVPLITIDRDSTGGNINNNKQPFVMFGSLTIIDDEVTEGEELGSAVVGRAQGFYFVSSLDGSSHTVAFTVIVHRHNEEEEEEEEDTISFFGVHRRVSPESPIAVVGGTGKYEKAGGFAVIENLRRGENQHMTDGVDTIVHFSVYLSN